MTTDAMLQAVHDVNSGGHPAVVALAHKLTTAQTDDLVAHAAAIKRGWEPVQHEPRWRPILKRRRWRASPVHG